LRTTAAVELFGQVMDIDDDVLPRILRIQVEGITLKFFSDPLLDVQRRQFDCTLICGFNLTILRHQIDKLYVRQRLFRMCGYAGEEVSGDQACDQPKACSFYHHDHPSKHAAKICNEPDRGQATLA